jgi:hypothetical protein
MNSHIKVVIFAFASLVLSTGTPAQEVIPPGQFQIDGIPVSCGPAPTALVGQGLGDLAKTNQQGIWINWPMFQMMPTVVKLFTYAHECGHVNQILSGLPISEDQADMFALQLGKSQNFIDIQGINVVCAFLWSSAGDWTHKPGRVRCENMLYAFPNLD